MKAFITFVTSLGAVLYLSGIPAYSQGKGPGQVPSVNQAHSQGADNSHQANGVSSDHAKSEKLPQGMDLKTTESGFKNHGQFIAALHVPKNVMIPFDQLKAKMTGVSVNAAGQTTNSTPMSLGKAIHGGAGVIERASMTAEARQNAALPIGDDTGDDGI